MFLQPSNLINVHEEKKEKYFEIIKQESHTII